jgi:hypothetical protein
VDRKPDVLQHRVEVLPLGGRGIEPQKGVRGEDDEGDESRRDQALDRKHARVQACRQTVPEKRDQRAEDREDQRPKQHGAFVIAPDARHLEDQGDGGMRILSDRGDREVRDHIGGSQHREGDHDEARHGEHERARERHHLAILVCAPGERRGREQDRHGEREKESEEAGFGDHERIPTGRSAWTESALTFGFLLFA